MTDQTDLIDLTNPNTQKVVKTYICGCVRNCAQYLPAVFANIEKIAALFDDYQIVIAYDQSTDLSLKILCDIKKLIPKLEILVNKQAIGNVRTENIANARNQLLRYMRRQQEQSLNLDFDYFIMIDMDDVCAGTMNLDVLRKYIYIEKQNTNLHHQDNASPDNANLAKWDALSFNRPIYYDAWALSLDPFISSCWHFPKGREVVYKMRRYVQERLLELSNQNAKSGRNDLLLCGSAFNGFALYRMSKFENVQYEGTVQKNLEIISRLDFENTAKAARQSLSWHRTDDCEHRYFHIRATQLNGARICISPDNLFTDEVDG